MRVINLDEYLKRLCEIRDDVKLNDSGDSDDNKFGRLTGIAQAYVLAKTLYNKNPIDKSEEDFEDIDICMYDIEERYENCTVQILKNSVTGRESVGWWRNETD